jgi:hypothetical protein
MYCALDHCYLGVYFLFATKSIIQLALEYGGCTSPPSTRCACPRPAHVAAGDVERAVDELQRPYRLGVAEDDAGRLETVEKTCTTKMITQKLSLVATWFG